MEHVCGTIGPLSQCVSDHEKDVELPELFPLSAYVWLQAAQVVHDLSTHLGRHRLADLHTHTDSISFLVSKCVCLESAHLRFFDDSDAEVLHCDGHACLALEASGRPHSHILHRHIDK